MKDKEHVTRYEFVYE